MKKVFKALLLLSFILGIFTSCRKGPEDPFFSFLTRKARLVGDWQAQTYTINGKNFLDRVEYDTILDTILGCGYVYIKDSIQQEVFMSFLKDGSFSSSNIFHYIHYVDGDDVLCPFIDKTETGDSTNNFKGFWNFTGNVGDLANKEQLFIYQEENGVGNIWDIIGLRDDEVHLERKYIVTGQSVFTYEDLVLIPK